MENIKFYTKKLRNLFLIFLIFACNNKKEKLKELDFYNKSISIPTYLSKDFDENNPNLCKNNLYLKDKEDTFMSFELCNYRYNKRQNFDNLNSFFNEECLTLEEEIVGLVWGNRKSFNKEEYYEFTFDYSVNGKYYHVTYLAYEKFFISIKINSKEENQLKELIKLNNNNKVFNDLIMPNKNEKYCLNCKFPTFW